MAQTHADRIARLEAAVFGNGSIGHDEQLRKIWEWIQLEREKEYNRKKWWDKLQWTIIPLVVTAVFAMLGQAIYFYIVLVPKIMELP